MPSAEPAPYLEIVKASLLDRSSLEAHLAAIVESSDDAIISKSLDGTILSWNRGAEQLYGHDRAQAVGQPIYLIVPEELHSEVEGLIRRVAQGERVEHHDTRRQHQDGRIVEVSLTISPIRNPDGVIVAASVIARDITERKRLERHLVRIASEDQLTGLANRRLFMRSLDHHIDACARLGWRGTLMMLDIDRFKAINDTLGHSAGDQVIKQTAARLRLAVGSGDVLARLGGDEFAVLLPEARWEHATACADRIVAELAAQEITIGGQRCATASLGWTMLNEAMTGEEALIRADLASYKAKSEGGNRAESFSSHQGAPRPESWGPRPGDGLELADVLRYAG